MIDIIIRLLNKFEIVKFKLSTESNFNNNFIFFIKSESNPSKNFKRNQDLLSNRNQVDGNDEIEPNLDNENSEDLESINQDNNESREDELVENELNNENTRLDEKKKKLFTLILKNPSTYLFGAIALTIIFIILAIVVLFPKQRNIPPVHLLCGGDSKIDNIIIITTDAEGNPIEKLLFYDYIKEKLYSELGPSENQIDKIPYQVQAIAIVSKILNLQYNPDTLTANLEKLNTWCNSENKEKLQINCSNDIYNETEIIILQSEIANEQICNSLTGCKHWKNKGYNDIFGIKDGSCINEYRPLHSSKNNQIIQKYCPVKNNKLKEDELDKLKKDYEFKKEDDILYVLVKAESVFEETASLEEVSFIVDVVESVRGVLMVNKDGNPELTEYDNSENCSKEDNVMCTRNSWFGGENIFTQAQMRNWPVHKILTFWYSYYFASWSESGRESCDLYKPKNEGSMKTLNLKGESERTDIKALPNTTPGYQNTKPEFDYFKKGGGSLLSTFARLKNKRKKDLVEKLDPNIKIKELTNEDVRNEFNRYIRDSVRNKGIGTGPGVAMAAISLANYMEFENYRLPYTFEGAYQKYGMNPSWGTKTKDENSYWAKDAIAAWNPYFPGIEHHVPYGLDCLGFIDWAIKNGGVYGNILSKSGSRVSHLYGNRNLTRLYEELEGHSNVGWFGDALWRGADGVINKNPHGKLVIGVVYDVNNVLIGNWVAESGGPWHGLRISMIDIKTGERIRQDKNNPIYSEGSENEEPKIIGYPYYISDPKKEGSSPYGVIDLSPCYNQTDSYLCEIDTDENFFKGIITDEN